MPALAQRIQQDLQDRAANDDDIKGGVRTRTKFGYDMGANGKGRLTSLTDGSGSTSWTYTSQGRVATRTQVMGVMTKSVGYGYDTAGRLQSIALPSGANVTYGYAEGRISSVAVNGSPVATSVLYEPFGPTRGWTWGNSTYAIRGYTTDGNVAQIDSNGLKTYSYDDAFRIIGITDTVTPGQSWSYGYDLLDRLTSATRTAQTQGWTYDANGNRLTETGNTPSTFTVSTTSNRLNAVSGTLSRTYGYDAAGNTTADGGRTFTYNDAGRMKTYVKDGVTTTLTYNGLGQRVTKSNVSGVHYFVYDESGHLLGEYDASGALFQETVWMGDIPVAALWPNGSGGVTVTYIHTDHLNTPRAITRTTDNAVLWRWRSDPFGTDAAEEDVDGDTVLARYYLRFPGQFYDFSSGLNYNYFRDYDPTTGKYVESDPIGLSGGVGTFSYATANPVSHVDASGLYSGPMHRLITLSGASSTCISGADAIELAEAVVNVDKGTQDVWQSHYHGMCAAGLTSAQCRANYSGHIKRNRGSCDRDSLARLLHAVEDSYAAGHRNSQVYYGFGSLLWPPDLTHFFGDFFPPAAEQTGVSNVVRNAISDWCSRCNTCNRGASGSW